MALDAKDLVTPLLYPRHLFFFFALAYCVFFFGVEIFFWKGQKTNGYRVIRIDGVAFFLCFIFLSRCFLVSVFVSRKENVENFSS